MKISNTLFLQVIRDDDDEDDDLIVEIEPTSGNVHIYIV